MKFDESLFRAMAHKEFGPKFILERSYSYGELTVNFQGMKCDKDGIYRFNEENKYYIKLHGPKSRKGSIARIIGIHRITNSWSKSEYAGLVLGWDDPKRKPFRLGYACDSKYSNMSLEALDNYTGPAVYVFNKNAKVEKPVAPAHTDYFGNVMNEGDLITARIGSSRGARILVGTVSRWDTHKLWAKPLDGQAKVSNKKHAEVLVTYPRLAVRIPNNAVDEMKKMVTLSKLKRG